MPPLLFLIGYRGSGKTTVGRILADRLRWAFVDADSVLEERHRRTIRAIFATEGEAALVLGKYAEAHGFYQNALGCPSAGVGFVQSAYHQLCRLWHVLNPQELGRLVDDLFVPHATWRDVEPGPVGDCGNRKARGLNGPTLSP